MTVWKVRTSALIAILALVMAACGGGGGDGGDTAGSTDGGTETSGEPVPYEEAEQLAVEESRLTFYTSTSQEVAGPLAEAFMEEHPEIAVQILRLSSGPLNTRIAGEFGAGVFEADVIDTSSDELYQENPEWFKTLTPELVPNLADWPDSDKSEKYITSSFGEQSIVYNTELVEDPPTTWEDLLRPEFKDNCLWIDPRSSPTYMSWLKLMQETYGDEFLVGLGEQNCTLTDSGVPTSQEVAAGGALVGFPPVPSHFTTLIEEGAPIAGVGAAANSPAPAHGPEHFYSIAEESAHPNAARVFMNWYMTIGAQEINCAAVYGSPLPGVEGCAEMSDEFQGARFDITDEEIATMMELTGLE